MQDLNKRLWIAPRLKQTKIWRMSTPSLHSKRQNPSFLTLWAKQNLTCPPTKVKSNRVYAWYPWASCGVYIIHLKVMILMLKELLFVPGENQIQLGIEIKQLLTLSKIFSAPSTKPASILPIPNTNCPNAPAVHVWESVPTKTWRQIYKVKTVKENILGSLNV